MHKREFTNSANAWAIFHLLVNSCRSQSKGYGYAQMILNVEAVMDHEVLDQLTRLCQFRVAHFIMHLQLVGSKTTVKCTPSPNGFILSSCELVQAAASCHLVFQL